MRITSCFLPKVSLVHEITVKMFTYCIIILQYFYIIHFSIPVKWNTSYIWRHEKNKFSWVSIKPVIQWYSDVSHCTLWLPYSHAIVPYFKEYTDIVSKNDHFPCYSLKLILYCKGRIVQEINFCLYVAVKYRVNKIWIRPHYALSNSRDFEET